MDDLLTTREAAAELGVCPQRVRQLLAQGRLPTAIRPGRDWLIPRAAILALRRQPHGVRLGRSRQRPGRAEDGTD